MEIIWVIGELKRRKAPPDSAPRAATKRLYSAALEIFHYDVTSVDAAAYLLLESCEQCEFRHFPILSGIQRPFLKRNMVVVGAPDPTVGVLVPIDQGPFIHDLPPNLGSTWYCVTGPSLRTYISWLQSPDVLVPVVGCSKNRLHFPSIQTKTQQVDKQ